MAKNEEQAKNLEDARDVLMKRKKAIKQLNQVNRELEAKFDKQSEELKAVKAELEIMKAAKGKQDETNKNQAILS